MLVPPIPGDDDGASLQLLLRERVQHALHEIVQVAPLAPYRHLRKKKWEQNTKNTRAGPRLCVRNYEPFWHPGKTNKKARSAVLSAFFP